MAETTTWQIIVIDTLKYLLPLLISTISLIWYIGNSKKKERVIQEREEKSMDVKLALMEKSIQDIKDSIEKNDIGHSTIDLKIIGLEKKLESYDYSLQLIKKFEDLLINLDKRLHEIITTIAVHSKQIENNESDINKLYKVIDRRRDDK